MSERVERLAAARTYDLHVLTEPDFPFVQDGTRKGERTRHEMHRWFLDALNERGSPYASVGGTHAERMRTATGRIDPLLPFQPLRTP